MSERSGGGTVPFIWRVRFGSLILDDWIRAKDSKRAECRELGAQADHAARALSI